MTSFWVCRFNSFVWWGFIISLFLLIINVGVVHAF